MIKNGRKKIIISQITQKATDEEVGTYLLNSLMIFFCFLLICVDLSNLREKNLNKNNHIEIRNRG